MAMTSVVDGTVQPGPPEPVRVLVVEPDAGKQLQFVMAAQETRSRIDFTFHPGPELVDQEPSTLVDVLNAVEPEAVIVPAGREVPEALGPGALPADTPLLRPDARTFSDLMALVTKLNRGEQPGLGGR